MIPTFVRQRILLIKSLITLGVLMPIGMPGQDAAEILGELRKINQRLDHMDDRLSSLESGNTSGSDQSGAVTGSRVSFYRDQDVRIEKYPIPSGQPHWTNVATSESFSPNLVRAEADYPEATMGLAVWEGQISFDEGEYEFTFSWDRYLVPGSTPYLGIFQLTSPADQTNFTLEAWSRGGVEKAVTRDATLSRGIYNVKLVGCTTKYGDVLSLILRYRKRGGTWTLLKPISLVPPP